jgi:glycosyltransferase involved in cell wall biosynthesis
MIHSITHLTSVHSRYDTRIFIKECCSLAKNDQYLVHLVVADGKGDEYKDGVYIFDVGYIEGRLNRIIKTTRNIYKKAEEIDSHVYHFHDPELIPIALKLKKLGKKVIFDIHENVSLQIKDKKYMNYITRNIVSWLYRTYEKKAIKKFDKLILAENSYSSYYKSISPAIEVVLNMPDITALSHFRVIKRSKNGLFYIGGISNERGLDVVLEALRLLNKKYPDVMAHYIGKIDRSFIHTLDLHEINNNINFYDAMPLFDGLEISREAKVGLSILKPLRNYTQSYSTKVFEYMALGLPVVTSNFKLYKDVVERYNCGLCVDPNKPEEIANAVISILDNSDLAKEMGENGIRVAEKKFNWAIEEQKLYSTYKELFHL